MTFSPLPVVDDGNIRLRPLREADLPVTRAWRNHPDSREWFLSTALVTEEGHEGWYRGYLGRTDDAVFIVEADGAPVAQVSLSDIAVAEGTAEFGRLLVDPDRRGQGISHLATALCIRAAEQLGLRVLTLEVKASNARALRAYERAGFVRAGEADGVVAMILRLDGHLSPGGAG